MAELSIARESPARSAGRKEMGMDLVQDQDLHAEVAKKADRGSLQLDDCRARVLRRADDSEDLRVKSPLVRSTR
jgi:hypothetical protein